MKKMKLIETVTVTGPDFFGRNSSITFTPTATPGWYLETEDQSFIAYPDGSSCHVGTSKKFCPIDHRIAQSKPLTIQISFGTTVVNNWEHIGVLRFMGIDGIKVSMPKGQKWPPYLGGAGAYYEKISRFLRIQKEELPTIDVKKENGWHYKKRVGSYVEIDEAGPDSLLRLNVIAEWKPLPKHSAEIIVDEKLRQFLIDKILPSKPQGFPFSRHSLAKVASRFGWPNIDNISWRKNFSKDEEVSYWWWLHRVQDLLGTLSLCSNTHLPIGKVLSKNAGHKADLIVIKKAF